MHDMVARMNNHKVGLVHQMPFTTDQSGFAAAIEKVWYCQYSTRSMYILFVFKVRKELIFVFLTIFLDFVIVYKVFCFMFKS